MKYKDVVTVKSHHFKEKLRETAISGSRSRSMTLKMTSIDPAWRNLKISSLNLLCSSGIFGVIRENVNFWLTLPCLGPPVAKIGVLPDITNSVSKAANKGDYYMWKPDKSNDNHKAHPDFYKKPTSDARSHTNRFLAKETIVPFTRKRFLPMYTP